MESKRSKNQPVLLPLYFKKIGLLVMMLAIIPGIIVKSMTIELGQQQKELLHVFILDAFILGLLFIAWSKDKVEDEMTVAIRLKSIAGAFTWAVFYVIIQPLISLLLKDPTGSLTGQEVVMSMLLFYLMMYYLQKLGR